MAANPVKTAIMNLTAHNPYGNNGTWNISYVTRIKYYTYMFNRVEPI